MNLRVVARKKYALRFSMGSLHFPLETREDSVNLPEFLEKKVGVLWKTKGILLPRNYIEFPLVKVIACQIAYESFENTKNIHFLTDYQNVRENFFRTSRM